MIWKKQSAKLISIDNPLKLIEYCARVCYASTDKIKEGSAMPFVKGLVDNHHWTPLEHAYIHIYLDEIEDFRVQSYVEGMYRVAAPGDWFFADRKLTRGAFYRGQDERGRFLAGNMRDIYVWMSRNYDSLDLYNSSAVSLADDYAVFEILTDRGVATEFFRHRTMSYDDDGYERGAISAEADLEPDLSINQQSTRYVNFNKKEFSVILPEPAPFAYNPGSPEYQEWLGSCQASYDAYRYLMNTGVSIEYARNVLPLSLATTVIMSGSIRNWMYVMNLRLARAAHPQARLLACYIFRELEKTFPHQIDEILAQRELDDKTPLVAIRTYADAIEAEVHQNKELANVKC